MAEKHKKKSRTRGIDTKAKKKRASARAVIKRGTGIVKINRRDLALTEPRYLRDFIREPLDMSGELAGEVDISVNAKGGGFMAQAAAARGAIAKGLLEFRSNDKLKQAMIKYDRQLIVDDSRRVEPKKPLGPKARKKKQTSKR
ncbi:MAG: 30S ribosomal protein S9 [Candidatus Diapherotrites archaeon]